MNRFISIVAFLVFNLPTLNPAKAQIYFQQDVSYKIEVALNDKKNELSAFETIVYTNNSPFPLKELYFHLWANAYQNRETALCEQMVENGDTKLFFATDDERGYIDSLDFKADGKSIEWQFDSINIDICKLTLPKKLESGDQVIISTPFHVKIPSATFSRLGHLGQSYMITQWYPKPAVFDAQGWHAMPYLQMGEFYSEFGSYEVSITLPKNYVVGATGDLQNAEELNWLNKRAEETSKINYYPADMSFPASDKEMKTITYKQSKVHDFAWFADKRYHVLKGELVLPESKKKVTLWSMFTNDEADLWKHSIEYIHDGAYYYSLWNGDYKYNQITAVDGTISAGSGMEYPNIAVIGTSHHPFLFEMVIVHEVGHNWFYGMLGTNERDHAWMDEGINFYYEIHYALTKYPPEKLGAQNEMMSLGSFYKLFGFDKIDYRETAMSEYLFSARSCSDQPIDLTSKHFTEINYWTIVYSKTAISFNYLRAFLGGELFDKCMQSYFRQWQLMHPYPDDLQNVFEDVSHENLDWFFNDIIKTTKKVDYKICSAKKNPDATYTITIENKGTAATPLIIAGLKEGRVAGSSCYTGFEKKSKINFAAGDYDRIAIGNDYDIPDVNLKNNFIRTRGILKKWEPVQFKFLSGVERPMHSQVYYTPVAGWNNYDKWIAGAAIHNFGIIPKNFECLAMPMYSFNAKDYAGSASAAYHFYKNEKFNAEVSVSAMHYAFGKINFLITEPNQSFIYSFTKFKPEVNFRFKKYARSTVTHTVSVKNYLIRKDDEFIIDSNIIRQKNHNEDYNDVIYSLNNSRALDPFYIKATFQNGKKFMKANLEAEYSFTYKRRKKGISLRIFAGDFIYNKADDFTANVNYKMRGFAGYDDYLFNHIYLGRTEAEGTLSRQFSEEDGAFKVNTGVGETDKWLAALNFKITIPGIPVMFYMDMGTYSNAAHAYDGSKAIMYNGGVGMWIIRDIAEVYFPLFYSSDISQNLQSNNADKFGDRIRFELNLNLLNPLKLQRQIFN